MEPNYDIAVIDSQGSVILAVEAKVKWGTDSEWATQLRRNIAVHGMLPAARYYLVALPDRFYLWDHFREASDHAWLEPKLAIEAGPVLEPYFERIEINTASLSGETFEFVLMTWLNDMIDASNAGIALDAASEWLDRSGLYKILKHSHVVLPELA